MTPSQPADGIPTDSLAAARPPRSKRLLVFALILVALFVTGVLLIALAPIVKGWSEASATEQEHARQWWGEFFHSLLIELGMALIIACMMAISVELFLRTRSEQEYREREQQIAQNVFGALFGPALGEDLVTELYSVIFKSKFIRENLTLKYEFMALECEKGKPVGRGKLLLLQQVVSFEARNITGTVASHNIEPYVDLIIRHAACADVFREVRVEGSDGVVIAWDGASLRKHVVKRGCRHRVQQLKVQVAQGECAKVRLVVQKVCQYVGTETWVTRYSAKGLRLLVEVHDKELLALKFSTDQAHRCALERAPHTETSGTWSHEWFLRNAILPYQGIMLSWSLDADDEPLKVGDTTDDEVTCRMPASGAPTPAAGAGTPTGAAPLPESPATASPSDSTTTSPRSESQT